MKSIKQSSEPEKKWTAEVKSIKQSQKRNELLKGNGIGRVLSLVAWRIECDTERLKIHWNAIERVTDIIGTQRYVVHVHVPV